MFMRCGLLSLFCSWVALAQMPSRDPIQQLIDAAYQARAAGRYGEAAAKREEARELLRRVPPDAQVFRNGAFQLARLYANSGKTAQQRAVLQEALDRTAPLGGAGEVRVQLLSAIADSWTSDRNLLQAADYREKALAEAEKAKADWGYLYQNLANLYLELGRKNDAAALAERLRERRPADPAVGMLYEQLGKTEEAAAFYQQQAQQAPQSSGPLQSLASLYEGEQRFPDAVAAMEQAIAAAEMPEAGTGPKQQVLWLRTRLANLQALAGRADAAEQIYQSLLAGPAGSDDAGLPTQYANFLLTRGQAAKAEQWLNDFLAAHAGLPPMQQANLLDNLANIARQAGGSSDERARQYAAAAAEKRRAGSPPAAEDGITELMNRAQSAACKGDALPLALEAIARAPQDANSGELALRVPGLAQTLSYCGKDAEADQLYQNLLPLLESWAADSSGLLANALNQRVNVLVNRKRWAAAQTALDRYRQLVAADHGEASWFSEDALDLQIRLDLGQGLNARAAIEAQDMLAVEAGLSGTVSGRYQGALERAASFLVQAGDGRSAVALWKQEWALLDQLYSGADAQRGFILANIARELAGQGEMEEAERVAAEALATDAKPQLTPWLNQEIHRAKVPAGTGPVQAGQAGLLGFYTKVYRP